MIECYAEDSMENLFKKIEEWSKSDSETVAINIKDLRLMKEQIEDMELNDKMSGINMMKIILLETICESLVKMPKGQETHSWSDYKSSYLQGN